MNTKQTLLKLSNEELREREKVRNDYYYFSGKCRDETAALSDRDLLGQSWIVADDLDYVPTQDIRNKIKPLLRKQARFMFGRKPDILLKPHNPEDKDKCEELRQFIDKILEENRFWSDTLKAFLMGTVKKRILLRLEANPEQPINIFYNQIEDFSYTMDSVNSKKIQSIVLAVQDPNSADNVIANEQTWYRYTYYMENGVCKFKKETFKKGNTDVPSEETTFDTGLNRLPAWVIINGGLLGDRFGESDITDLKDPQNQYNRRVSDFADALRFQMFGQTAVIDGTPDSVKEAKVAPNAILPIASIDDRKADVKKVESSFSNAEPVETFLKRAESDMYETISIPRPEQLVNIPSAKSMKYMYNDLIARCEEKWHDWETPIKEMLRIIIESCSKFNCYPNWNHDWDNLEFSIVIKHNYPIPEDMDDKKKLGMEEVKNNVRSVRGYIRDFTDDEDPELTKKEILEDLADITAVENEQYSTGSNII
jgi:hypothetical protein